MSRKRQARDEQTQGKRRYDRLAPNTPEAVIVQPERLSMTRACLMLLAGIYALQLSSFAKGSDLLEVIFVVFVAAVVAGRISDFLWFFTGIVLFGMAANGILNSRLAPQFAGDSIVVAVRIADFPATNGSSVSFMVEPLDDARVPPRVRLSWFEPPVALRLGDVWQLELRLRRPRGSSNPGVFDYEAWLFRERIGAVGYVVGGHRNHLKYSGNLGMPFQSAHATS